MKLKVNWLNYLHKLRSREIAAIFSSCPPRCFDNALELGAGDGFQSTLLANYTRHLLCTEVDDKRLVKKDIQNVTYKVMNAQDIDRCLEYGSYDMVFFFFFLEHVHRREELLQKICKVLNDDGICVCVVPNVLLKLSWLVLFYPNQLIELLEVISNPGGLERLYKRVHAEIFKGRQCDESSDIDITCLNNRKSKEKTFCQKYCWPTPHGEYSSNILELFAYRKNAWSSLIEKQGFNVISILKMPVMSGYGFGWDLIRRLLERMGLCSSYAFIFIKKGKISSYAKYWQK